MSKSKKWINDLFKKSKETTTSTTFSPEESPTDQNYPNYTQEKNKNQYIPKYNGEKVLVFKSEILKNQGYFQGMIIGESAGKIRSSVLTIDNLFYIDRDIAENDPSYKQVIPYCVFTKNSDLFIYQRSKKASENRLHDLWSVGVGGHINPCDGLNSETISNACKREIEEEVSFTNPKNIRFIGLINDDTTPVNSVHFGVVFHVILNDVSNFNPVDKSLSNGEFRNAATTVVSDINLEDWSVYVMRNYLRNIF